MRRFPARSSCSRDWQWDPIAPGIEPTSWLNERSSSPRFGRSPKKLGMVPLSRLPERSRVCNPTELEREAEIGPSSWLDASRRTRSPAGNFSGRPPERELPSRSRTSSCSSSENSAGISPVRAWKGRESMRSSERAARAGERRPASRPPGSGQGRRNEPERGQEGEGVPGAETLTATTRDRASQATPGQEQASVEADQAARRLAGSATEFLNWKRAVRSVLRSAAEEEERRLRSKMAEVRIPAGKRRRAAIAGGEGILKP